MRIIDRCKAHFKLAQGIFVAPAPLEATLRRSPLVAQAFVWGTGTMRAVVAVVVPSAELVSALSSCEEGGRRWR